MRKPLLAATTALLVEAPLWLPLESPLRWHKFISVNLLHRNSFFDRKELRLALFYFFTRVYLIVEHLNSGRAAHGSHQMIRGYTRVASGKPHMCTQRVHEKVKKKVELKTAKQAAKNKLGDWVPEEVRETVHGSSFWSPKQRFCSRNTK
jgi:hypothetical protein